LQVWPAFFEQKEETLQCSAASQMFFNWTHDARDTNGLSWFASSFLRRSEDCFFLLLFGLLWGIDVEAFAWTQSFDIDDRLSA
jgi:hypothetical protein